MNGLKIEFLNIAAQIDDKLMNDKSYAFYQKVAEGLLSL